MALRPYPDHFVTCDGRYNLPTDQAGSFTGGCYFFITARDSVIAGARVYIGVATPRVYKISLYAPAAVVPLTTVDLNTNGVGEYEAIFPSPELVDGPKLAAQRPDLAGSTPWNGLYCVSIYDKDGIHSNYGSSNDNPEAYLHPGFGHTSYRDQYGAAGDTKPVNNAGARYFIAPVVYGGAVEWSIADSDPPTITPISPTDGQENTPKTTPLVFDVVDAVAGVQLTSVAVRLSGRLVVSGGRLVDTRWAMSYVAISNGYRFTITPRSRFGYWRNEPNQIDVDAVDMVGNAAHESWTFYGESIGPQIYAMIFDGVRRGD